MARLPASESIYDAAEKFRRRCLVDGTSFLWHDHPGVWSPSNIDALLSAYIGHPDTGDRSFLEKWHDQLDGQPDDIYRLAADAMALYCLYPTNMSGPTKIRTLQEIINWKLTSDPSDLAFLERAFVHGIGGAGIHYQTSRPEEIAFYLTFGQAVVKRGIDPYKVSECTQVADEVMARTRNGREARNVILHLLFPDQFERIVSHRHKQMIVKRFSADAGVNNTLDEALAHIKQGLMDRMQRPNLDFYDPDVKRLWDPEPAEPRVRRGARSPRDETTTVWLFQANQQLFDLSQQLQQVAVGDADDWIVTRYRDEMRPGDVVLLWQSGEYAGIYALGELTGRPEYHDYGGSPPAWISAQSTESTRAWRVPFRYTTILHEPLLKTRLVQLPVLRDLDVLRMAQATNFRVTLAQWEALQNLIAQAEHNGPTLEDLAARTYISPAELAELETLLVSKQQLILAGPPGSGKTFVAELLARYMAGVSLDVLEDDHLLLVQFHQSYSYEDFVQGIRPETGPSGALEYRVRDGIFKQFCAVAQHDPDHKYVFVIDEINRGNISRIFGELLLLLEYRRKQVRLPYARPEDPPFAIPENVFIIGTMNTADRSLAQLDFALRRRFYFHELLPVIGNAAPVLAGWLDEHEDAPHETGVRILQLFLALNQRISEELGHEFQVGHSYFMVEGIEAPSVLKRVWRHSITPLLEEYFFSHRDRERLLHEFELDRLLEASQSGESRAEQFGQ